MSEQHTKPNKTFIISLVFIALIIVAGAAILLRPGASEPEPPRAGDTPSDPATAHDAEELAGIEPSVCGLAPDPDMSMDTPPEHAEAVTVGLVKVPGSDTFGPAEQNNEVPTCWQYSEAGAVSAAYTFAAIGTDAPRLTLDHLKAHLADGPGREKLIDQLETADSMGTDSAPIKPVGYRVLEFENKQAGIDILVENTEEPGVYGALKFPLIWQHGDWKLEVQDDGEYYSELRNIPDTSNFTTWEVE